MSRGRQWQVHGQKTSQITISLAQTDSGLLNSDTLSASHSSQVRSDTFRQPLSGNLHHPSRGGTRSPVLTCLEDANVGTLYWYTDQSSVHTRDPELSGGHCPGTSLSP